MADVLKTYGNAIKAAFNKEIDFNDGNVKVMLLSDSYTPDQDAHDYLDDVNTYEVTGTGYTAGGAALSNPAVTYTADGNVTKFDADDTTWGSSTITARYAVIYYNTGTASTSPLIAFITFDADKSSSSGNFTISWNSSGLFTTTAD